MAVQNTRNYLVIQWLLLVISVGLTIATVVDLVGGATGSSLWIAVFCWPIVAVSAVIGIVRHSAKN